MSDFLDVGCGTGQLAIQVAKLGIRSVGLDFAPDMIRIAEENNKKENANALFVCSSLFDAQYAPASYDVISAQGVIEYISLDELEVFFGLCSTALRAGGSLALASRNRLFNVVSLNSFTKMEMELGIMDLLIKEAICLQVKRCWLMYLPTSQNTKGLTANRTAIQKPASELMFDISFHQQN